MPERHVVIGAAVCTAAAWKIGTEKHGQGFNLIKSVFTKQCVFVLELEFVFPFLGRRHSDRPAHLREGRQLSARGGEEETRRTI